MKKFKRNRLSVMKSILDIKIKRKAITNSIYGLDLTTSYPDALR